MCSEIGVQNWTCFPRAPNGSPETPLQDLLSVQKTNLLCLPRRNLLSFQKRNLVCLQKTNLLCLQTGNL